MVKNLISSYKAPLLSLVVLWLLSCALALFGLGDAPLRDFDEATVARVAFELSTHNRDSQFLPTLWGFDYINKPPGLHVLIAAVISLSRNLHGQLDSIPSEFVVRLAPAFLSTLVVPFGGLLQWYLRPNDPIASVSTASILLTLLPIARHGRLAMLDGAQLSAMALLWLLLLSFDQSRLDRLRALCGGLISSFLLLLKAPFLIPALLAVVIPIFLGKRFMKLSILPLASLFGIGLLPGISWHIWNGINRGSDALWLWGGDGAARVLFSAGEGSDLGFLVPVLEILEGGWPWLIFWPFGMVWAWKERHTSWGQWSLITQIVLAMAILPLKTQLPWYSHPLWLPFALICGPPFAWVIHRKNSKNVPGKYLLARVPYVLIIIGTGLLFFGIVGALGFFASLRPYSGIAFTVGIGWIVGGWLLTRSLIMHRSLGAITVLLGNFVALLLLMGSGFWVWELNESWSVKPVAQMISNAKATGVFIEGNHERPSLNWYAGQHVKRFEEFSTSGWVLTKNQNHFIKVHPEKDCSFIQEGEEWDLMFCKVK